MYNCFDDLDRDTDVLHLHPL